MYMFEGFIDNLAQGCIEIPFQKLRKGASTARIELLEHKICTSIQGFQYAGHGSHIQSWTPHTWCFLSWVGTFKILSFLWPTKGYPTGRSQFGSHIQPPLFEGLLYLKLHVLYTNGMAKTVNIVFLVFFPIRPYPIPNQFCTREGAKPKAVTHLYH